MRNKVKITSDGTPRNTKIYIDGVQLTNVQSLNFYIDVDKPSLVTITMIDAELELEGIFNNRTDPINECTCSKDTIFNKGCQCGGI